MGIGRLGLIFFMIGGMLFVVLRSWADNIFGYTGSAAF